MKIDWLKPLLGHPGPFATVYIDATRANVRSLRQATGRDPIAVVKANVARRQRRLAAT